MGRHEVYETPDSEPVGEVPRSGSGSTISDDATHRHLFVGMPDDGWYDPPRDGPSLLGEGMMTFSGRLWHAHDELGLHLHYQNTHAAEPVSGNGPKLYNLGPMQETSALQEGRY